MKLLENDILQLEAYWDGSLPEPQMKAMEDRLQKDDAFREAAEKLRLTVAGLHTLGDRNLRRFLQTMEEGLPPVIAPPMRPLVQWQWWVYHGRRAAAVAALFLGLFTLFWMTQRGTIYQRLAAQNFHAYKVIDYLLGDVEQGQKGSEHAFQVYEAGDFKEALPLFEAQFRVNGEDLTLFYVGISALGAKKADAAIDALTPLLNSGDLVPLDAVQWYLALAYLEKNRPEEAQRFLEKVARESGEFQTKSSDLLKHLK